MDMRGLTNFIADIRAAANSKDQEEKRINEELAKIKAKFKSSGTLSPYDKKKYVCKLMFITMLGYDVNFGRMEGVELLSGKTQSEKLIGYLAVSVFLHENHELTTLVTHTVNLDLVSGKEFNMTLALAAISNIGGRDFAEVMSSNVTKILGSKTASSTVKKRALLTALRLFRKYPEVLSVEQLLPIALKAIDGTNFSDLGVTNCGLSLITGLLNNQECSLEVLAMFDSVPDHCINIMTAIIVLKKTPPSYMYYGVPAPWIQMKCLRLLQYFPCPEDPTTRSNIITILGKIIKLTGGKYREAAGSNKRALLSQCTALVAVLTEVVGLVVHWECDPHLLNDATELLSLLIRTDHNCNMRYTGLKLMTRLSFVSVDGFSFIGKMAQHQQQIIVALSHTDITIRKSALDLLYCMCTRGQSDEIVGELLLLLPVAEGAFRQDLVLMIAVIAEKFCTDYTWYVEVMSTVITQAGDEVPTDIWQRLCHVVVNNEVVQKQAAETFLKALNAQNHAPEVLVKVAAFLLGEFGYQIAVNADSGPMMQFNALHSRFMLVGLETKCMLLTTYVKFYNLYDNPALRDRVKKTLMSNKSSMDPELQQRATEYVALITSVSDEVLQDTLEPMLPFVINTYTLLDRLTERQKGTDRNLWSEKSHQRDAEQLQAAEEERQQNAERSAVKAAEAPPVAQQQPQQAAKPAYQDPFAEVVKSAPSQGNQDRDDPMDSLMGTKPKPTVDLSGPPPPKKADVLDDIFSISAPPKANVPTSSSSSAVQTMREVNFPKLCVADSGVLYQDDVIAVSVNPHQYRNADGRLSLQVQNRTSGPLLAFSSRIVSTVTSLLLQSKPHENEIAPGQTATILYAARCMTVYADPPEIQLSFSRQDQRESTTLTLPLPIVVTRFIAPYQLDDPPKFLALWDNTGCGVAQLAAFSSIPTARPLEVTDVEGILFQKLRCHTLRPSGTTVYGVGAHAVQPAAAPEFTPVLVKIEIEAMGTGVQLAVRTPNPVLQEALHRALSRLLKQS